MAARVLLALLRHNERHADLPYRSLIAIVTVTLLTASGGALLILYLLRWKGWRLAFHLAAPAGLVAWVVLRRVVWTSPADDDRPVVVVAFLAAVVALVATAVSFGRALWRWHRHWWFDLGRDPARATASRQMYVALLASTTGLIVATWSLRTDWGTACGPDDPDRLAFLRDLLVLSDRCEAVQPWAELASFGILTGAALLALTGLAARPDAGVAQTGDPLPPASETVLADVADAVERLDVLAAGLPHWSRRQRGARRQVEAVRIQLARHLPPDVVSF